jgi:hypothetical protein
LRKFIHHDRASSDWMAEDEGFDVIETEDGFHVYDRDRLEETYDTLDEATEAMHRLLEEADAAHTEEERKKLAAAREAKALKVEAAEIANITSIIINQRRLKFPATTYAAQALLEEVIAQLQWRV